MYCKSELLSNEFYEEVLVGSLSICAITWWVKENAGSNDGFKQNRTIWCLQQPKVSSKI